MSDRASIVRELVAEAIEEINLQLPPEQRLVLEDEEMIIAPGSKLDSLQLVHFLIGLEGSLEGRLGHPVPLTTDDILA